MTVQAPGPIIPAECYIIATERRATPEPALEPETQPDPFTRLQAQLRNARLGLTYWRDRTNIAEEQADTNAPYQNACASKLAEQQQ